MDSNSYGPFATVVALVLAMAATFSAALAAVSGRYESWRPPDEDLPGRLRNAVLVASLGVVVATYVLIQPTNVIIFVCVGAAMGAAAFFLIPKYSSQLGLHVYKQVEVDGAGQEILDENGVVKIRRRVIGGTEDTLKPSAVQALQEQIAEKPGFTVELLLMGTTPPYNAESLWPRSLIVGVRERLGYLLMGILLLSVCSAIILAFCLQVFLSHSRPGFDLKQLDGKQASPKPMNASTKKS